MAKHQGKDHPEDSHDPRLVPPVPPLDDIEEVVEFLDDDVITGPIEFGFEDEPAVVEPHATLPPAVPLAKPIHKPTAHDPNETDSVLDDDLVKGTHGSGIDSAQVSGVFSSVIRAEPVSSVLGNSEILRAEPLSDSVAIDPLSGIATMKADSDIRAEKAMPLAMPVEYDEVDLVEDAVLEDEAPRLGTSDIALPESAVREEAFGDELISDVDDSSVSLKSVRAPHKSPEKEPVLDLDDTMALDLPQPKKAERYEPTVAFDGGASDDDVEFHDLAVDATVDGGSAVNLGQKPTGKPGQSGIDPVAEELESGVRLDGGEAAKAPRPASPPSVEFDDLIVEDDVAAVDLGTDDSLQPLPQSGKLPSSSYDDMPAVVDEVVDVDEFANKATVNEDDIDINALMGDAPAAVGIEDDMPAVVDEAPIDIEDAPPVTTPKRGKRAGVSADAPAAYQEPKKRGWGGLIGGVVLGSLLTAGAAAGVYFTAPELITGPPAVAKSTVVMAPKSPLQLAHEAMDQGKYAEAAAILKDDEADDKAILATRGEALGFAYIQKQAAENAPVKADDPEAKLALADLTKSENTLRLQQMLKALDGKTAVADPVTPKGGDDALQKVLNDAVAKREAAEKVVTNMAKVLTEAKILAEGDKLDAAALQKIAKGLGETRVSLDAVNKALEDAKIDDPGEKGVEKLAAVKKDFEDKLAAVNKALEGAKVKDPGAKGLMEVLAARDKLAKDHDELAQTIKSAFQELVEGKLAPADGDPRKELIAGAKAARTKSESPLSGPLSSLANSLGTVTFGVGDLVKNAFDGAATAGEITYYRVREAFVPTPEQQLDRLAAALLNAQQKDATLIADANRLAEWVASNDAKFSPATKAKALYTVGLSQRNQGKFADARKTLQSAADAAKGNDGAWVAAVQKSLAEISDPNAYYIPRIEKLRAAKDYAGALEEINAAMAVMPDHPRLKTERGLIALEQSSGAIDAKDRETIRAEAQTAAGDPKSAASGNFVLGRLEEQAGNLPKAEEFFRNALNAVDADNEQAAQIRLSLGRLLLKGRGPGAPVPPPAPKKDEKEKEKEAEKDAGEAPDPKVSFVHPLANLLAAAILTQPPVAQDDESPEVQARLRETAELARKLIESKDKKIQAQGYFLLGEALARQGQLNDGIRAYAKGLEILHPDAQMSKLLDEHPAFTVPEGSQRANPLLAEKHYGVGLHLYHERRLADAETQFKQAIGYFDKDARYFYFLGLTQMEQNTKAKRAAANFAWEQASRLEANSRPSTREINITLERIQGDRRTQLNAFRAKATGAP